jgi:hypothetical protein
LEKSKKEYKENVRKIENFERDTNYFKQVSTYLKKNEIECIKYNYNLDK